MAGESSDGEFHSDEVVDGLVSDPDHVPDTRMYVGLLGASSREGYVRLYFTTELKDYLEVRRDDVLHTESLKTPENPLGGSAVWLRADAQLEVTRRADRNAPEDFLTGQITARNLRGARATGFAIGGMLAAGAGLKSVPPVESCVPSLCLPPPPSPDPPGTTAVCTLATSCRTEFLCF